MKTTASIGKTPQFSTLSREQWAPILCSAQSIMVKAPAGSGKTTLAMGYIAARPKARGLYMAFSKPAQLDAERRLSTMPVNTIACTQHSLAWRPHGAALSAAGKLNQRSGLRPRVTANLLMVNPKLASAINETLKNYMNSAEDVIGITHLPDEKDYPIVKGFPGDIIMGARKLWTRMTDLNDQEAQATDDVYLKQWVLTKPVLPFEFIIYDEAQDANPLTAHLINMQTHCSRLYIGDPHQSIFGFRGAVNLMDSLKAEESFALTQSFRFTPNIGLLASTYLKHWKGNDTPIIGCAPVRKIVDTDQTAYLSRTVAGLIATGFELHEKGEKIHWVKGFDDYRAGVIEEAYKLYKGESSSQMMDPVLKTMGSWFEFEDYVESTRDGDAGPVMRLIQKHKDDTPGILTALRENQVVNPLGARNVLTTAHKSKGLEWPVVKLVNDYYSFQKTERQSSTSKAPPKVEWMAPDEIDPQEANLMYVAITRAQKAIVLPPETRKWLETQEATRHLFLKKVAPEPTTQEEEAPAMRA